MKDTFREEVEDMEVFVNDRLWIPDLYHKRTGHVGSLMGIRVLETRAYVVASYGDWCK